MSTATRPSRTDAHPRPARDDPLPARAGSRAADLPLWRPRHPADRRQRRPSRGDPGVTTSNAQQCQTSFPRIVYSPALSRTSRLDPGAPPMPKAILVGFLHRGRRRPRAGPSAEASQSLADDHRPRNKVIGWAYYRPKLANGSLLCRSLHGAQGSPIRGRHGRQLIAMGKSPALANMF